MSMALMQIAIVESADLPGGVGLMLCDANGVPLPNQRDVHLDQSMDGPTSISVRFLVDGVGVCFAPAAPVAEPEQKYRTL